MRVRVEQVLIWCGVIGLLPFSIIAYLARQESGVPRFFVELFRGGAPAAVLTGLLTLLGIIGSFMYLVNMMTLVKAYKWKRLISMLLFYLEIGFVGATF